MPNSVFLDTNGWLALLNATESMHLQASSEWIKLGRLKYRVVLTDWIVAETGNGLSRTRGKRRFADELVQFRESPNVEFVIVDDSLLNSTLDLYCQHEDNSWGIVDCCSFIVMRERGITEAFTSDSHFEQAGFTRLLTG
jgi:hypothetical protein